MSHRNIKLTVLGNVFDKSLGLETSYIDFMNWMINEKVRSPISLFDKTPKLNALAEDCISTVRNVAPSLNLSLEDYFSYLEKNKINDVESDELEAFKKLDSEFFKDNFNSEQDKRIYNDTEKNRFYSACDLWCFKRVVDKDFDKYLHLNDDFYKSYVNVFCKNIEGLLSSNIFFAILILLILKKSKRPEFVIHNCILGNKPLSPNNLSPSWFDLEAEIKRIISEGVYVDKYLKGMINIRFLKIDLANDGAWFKSFDEQEDIEKNDIINSFKALSDDLKRYLNEVVYKAVHEDNIYASDKYLKLTKSLATDYVLTFNYTPFGKNCLKVFDLWQSNQKLSNLDHVHGDLNTQIVLGASFQDLPNRIQFLDFDKNFLRATISHEVASKKQDNVSDKKTEAKAILEENKQKLKDGEGDVLKLEEVLAYKDWLVKETDADLSVDFVFYGFSFGYSDADIIIELLTSKFNSVTIYYYALEAKKSIIKNLFDLWWWIYSRAFEW